MTEDTSKPWLPSAPSDCPVDQEGETWFKSSLYWFGRQFGTEIFYRDRVLPTAGFLADVNGSISAGQVEELVAHLCGLMTVDPGLVKVELFDGSAEKKEAARSGRKHNVGHFRMKDGQAIIALDETEFSDPVILTANKRSRVSNLRSTERQRAWS